MKKYKRIASTEKGFTLLEVMISMAIFSIGILGTVALQYAVVGGNTSGNVMNQELLLAQQVIEEKKNNTDVNSINNNIPATVNPGPYNIDIQITNPIGGSMSRFITVTIDRPGGVGGHPVTVRTLTMGSGI